MKRFLSSNPLHLLTEDSIQKLRLLEECADLDFVKAVEILGLNPNKDFRNSDLSGINLDGLNLDEYDFDGSEFDQGSFEKVVMSREADYSSERVSKDGKSIGLDSKDKDASDNQTLTWFRRRASEGNADAMKVLGAMHFSGKYLENDSVKAVEWFRRAAEEGDEEAAFLLGNCYAGGIGVASDLQKATKWYMVAAEKGNIDAMLSVATAYREGIGFEADKTQSLKWYRRAAERGDKTAAMELALFESHTGARVTAGTDETPFWISRVIMRNLPDVAKD